MMCRASQGTFQRMVLVKKASFVALKGGATELRRILDLWGKREER